MPLMPCNFCLSACMSKNTAAHQHALSAQAFKLLLNGRGIHLDAVCLLTNSHRSLNKKLVCLLGKASGVWASIGPGLPKAC